MILDFIAGIFKPGSDLIDNLHTSEAEKLTLRNEFAKIQGDLESKMVELEKARLDSLSKVQVAEASSKHWLTASWRPIVCLTLVGLIVLGSFGLVTLSPEIYQLSQVMLGGYTASRGIEKVTNVLKLGKS